MVDPDPDGDLKVNLEAVGEGVLAGELPGDPMS